jgi:predicted CopG family antitoxin
MRTLSDSEYEALESFAKDGDGFSGVIRRLTGSPILLSSFAGAWIGASKSDVDKVRTYLKDSDHLSRKKLRQLSNAVAKLGTALDRS